MIGFLKYIAHQYVDMAFWVYDKLIALIDKIRKKN